MAKSDTLSLLASTCLKKAMKELSRVNGRPADDNNKKAPESSRRGTTAHEYFSLQPTVRNFS
jgi:hypothetical protein